MMTTTKGLICAIAVTALGVGCSGGSDDVADSGTEPDVSTVVTTADTVPDGGSVAPDETMATTEDSVPAATSPPATEAPEPADPPLIEGVDPVELLTPSAEAGTQPELAWGAVDGAATYRLVILDADGAPYWSWSGPETSVFLGGGDSSDGAGPSVGTGFTWTVTAFDADGGLLAASAIGTLAT